MSTDDIEEKEYTGIQIIKGIILEQCPWQNLTYIDTSQENYFIILQKQSCVKTQNPYLNDFFMKFKYKNFTVK